MKITRPLKTAAILSVSMALVAPAASIDAKIENIQGTLSPYEAFRDLSYFEDLPKMSPSEQFASGSVFDIFRQYRDEFQEAVDSGDPMSVWQVFAGAYGLFLEHPEVAGFTADMLDMDADDTDPMTWNSDIFNLSDGDNAALLYMPVENDDSITARIVGIILSAKGDGFYYCMLDADENNPSDVKRNMAIDGIKTVGEVKGRGFELMNSFLECIKDDFYGNTSHENNPQKSGYFYDHSDIYISDCTERTAEGNAMLEFLTEKEDTDTDPETEMIIEEYSSTNPDTRQDLYYGDADAAAEILKPLREILFAGTEPTADQYSETGFFYIQAWTRKHFSLAAEFSTIPYIKDAMRERFSDLPADSVYEGVDLCMDYIYQHEPELFEQDTEINTSETDLSGVSDEYKKFYNEGYSLFEEGRYAEAIEAYKKCIAEREDITTAYFEITEAYILMSDFSKAKDTLLTVAPFITTSNDKARFYRRMGYIEVENINFDLAAALLLYSLQFEQNEIAVQELDYIEAVTGKELQYTDEMVLNILQDNEMLYWQN